MTVDLLSNGSMKIDAWLHFTDNTEPRSIDKRDFERPRASNSLISARLYARVPKNESGLYAHFRLLGRTFREKRLLSPDLASAHTDTRARRTARHQTWLPVYDMTEGKREKAYDALRSEFDAFKREAIARPFRGARKIADKKSPLRATSGVGRAKGAGRLFCTSSWGVWIFGWRFPRPIR